MKELLDAFQFVHVVQVPIGWGMTWKISFGFAGIVAHLTPVIQESKFTIIRMYFLSCTKFYVK